MNWILSIAIAYAALAGLVLALNLATPYRREIKISAIVLITILYVVTYRGLDNVQGWAIEEAPPNPFKLHWAVIEEPNKVTGDAGTIYILAQALHRTGAFRSKPRLYALPYSDALAQQIEDAKEQVEDGKLIEANLAYKYAKKPEKIDEVNANQGEQGNAANREVDRLELDFREIPRPDLPPKR